MGTKQQLERIQSRTVNVKHDLADMVAPVILSTVLFVLFAMIVLTLGAF